MGEMELVVLQLLLQAVLPSQPASDSRVVLRLADANSSALPFTSLIAASAPQDGLEDVLEVPDFWNLGHVNDRTSTPVCTREDGSTPCDPPNRACKTDEITVKFEFTPDEARTFDSDD